MSKSWRLEEKLRKNWHGGIVFLLKKMRLISVGYEALFVWFILKYHFLSLDVFCGDGGGGGG